MATPTPLLGALLWICLYSASALMVAQEGKKEKAFSPDSHANVSNRTKKQSCVPMWGNICAPSLVIMGADKCGTNALAAYLDRLGYQGQSIKGRALMREKKGWSGEINWRFDKHPLSESSAKHGYAINFEPAPAQTYDKSTTYLKDSVKSNFMANMKSALPNVKVMAFLCDPVKRPWSRMQMMRTRGHIDDQSRCPWFWNNASDHVLAYTQTIVAKLDQGMRPDDITECSWCGLFCMELVTGDYRPQINMTQAYYGERFKYFISESVLSDPVSFSHDLVDFLQHGQVSRLEDVGRVHSFNHDPRYMPKEGPVWDEFNALLAPRYHWNEVAEATRAFKGRSLLRQASVFSASPSGYTDPYFEIDDALMSVLSSK